MKTHRILALSAALLALAATARAHFVWLERDTATGTTAAFFGEWAAGLRETQEGYLKLIAAPQAFAADGTALPVEIQDDRIAVDTKDASAGDLRLTNRYFPEKGKNLVHYQAKLGRADTAAKLDLELVPASSDDNTFTLLLRGEPVADEDVTLFTASGWNRTWKTDAAGKVTIETPWPGQAVIEVGHVEKKPGEHDGRAYEAIRHVHTLTFDVPTVE